MTNALFIIGNGFDLSLGLKSKYSDFFDALKKEHIGLTGNDGKRFNTTISKYIEISQKISIWPLIFSKPYEKWIDVELGIKEFLLSDIISESLNVEKLLKHDRNVYSSDDTHKRISALYDILKIHDAKKNMNKNDINRLIYRNVENEIFKLEEEFKKYMLRITSEVNYKDIARERLNDLITLNRRISTAYVKNISILNFNYTSILENGTGSIDNFTLSERNIHGNLSGKIIFGIDSKNIRAEDEYLYSFTKTFKVVNNGYSNFKYSAFKINKDIEFIYFYGHSLGEQDYSYFQSIFDSVNLYNGRTKLIFIYSDYFLNTEEEKEKHRLKTNFDIAKLIEKYGESFENEKIKGKNLFHKLIVENRIEIILLNP